MKRWISVLLALMLVLTLFPGVRGVPASAQEDDTSLDRWAEAMDSVPDDPFEGEHTVKENPDGSKTYVFQNGSVATEYPDGSLEGVDIKGNKYYKDKDENITTTLPDGTSYTDHADGKKSFSEPGGKTTYLNPDNSFYEVYANTGLVKEYDAEGNYTALGFEGSDQRLHVDENGDVESGKITGPDGRTLELQNGAEGYEAHLVFGNGKQFDATESGSVNSAEGRTRTITVSGSDQCNGTWTEVSRNVDGMKTVEKSGDLTTKDGDQLQFEESFTYDKEGNPIFSKNNVAQVTTADGKRLWVDKNSQAWEYEDPGTGEKIVVDRNGNALEFNVKGQEFKAEYDEAGNPKTVNWKTDTGAVIQIAEGTASVTLPDGTKFEADGNGNVWKNGEQVQKDGAWVEGYGPAGDPGNPEDQPEESKPQEPAADADFTGCYYGAYDYTAYWDGGTQKQGQRGYYVYEYNGCYYLTRSNEPAETEALVREMGVETYFNRRYGDSLSLAEPGSYDAATGTVTYTERSELNEVQYIVTAYTITFDGKGGMTVEWDAQNVYQGEAEPQEAGTFTGQKQ